LTAIHFGIGKQAVPRILVVIPGLPEQRSGGGVMLYELLAWLADRVGPTGQVAVVVPVPHTRWSELEAVERDPAFPRTHWHPLDERRVPGLAGRLQRMLGPLPADMAKVATAENASMLEAIRTSFRPTVELAVSSWALAAYRGQAFTPGTRLFMVNVDPDIVRHDGPVFALGRLDADAALRKLACAIDRPKVRRVCRQALTTAARVGAVSPADIAPLDRLGGRSDTVYLPPLMRPKPLDRAAAVPNTVLITTNLGYQPNVTSLEWFLREVWPHVGLAELTIAGSDPRSVGERLCRGRERVRFVGMLGPAELDAAFARTAVAVNPTQTGSGFQVKLLDAIARGVPIVSTAWSNKLGPAIPSSDDPRELARLITARLTPGSTPPFDYAGFHASATAAWNAFLFEDRRPVTP
jgi:glycosyltransferase involved in cell wall biosynthesis